MLVRTDATETNLKRYYPIMQQLRSHLTQPIFIQKVQAKMQQGYQLVGWQVDEQLISIAGFSYRDSLAVGKHLYIEELVTDSAHHQQGYGQKLLEAVIELGQTENIEAVLLDSGTQRHAAHRFYLRAGFDIKAYLFVKSM